MAASGLPPSKARAALARDASGSCRVVGGERGEVDQRAHGVRCRFGLRFRRQLPQHLRGLDDFAREREITRQIAPRVEVGRVGRRDAGAAA